MYDQHAADPFLGSEAVAAGLTTDAALRSQALRRLFRDTYAGSAVEVDTRLRVRALSLRGGPGAVVAGPLAALAWGAECPWETGPELVVSTDLRLVRDGIRRRVDRLRPEEVAERFGVAVTTPLRTAYDLARREPLVEAVAAVDALARVGPFGAEDLRVAIRGRAGARGIVQAREVVELMDPLAESLMETRARVGLVLRGVPTPVLQHPVRLADGRRVYLDMAWPDPPSGRPTAVEYQGEDHRSIGRHGRDIDRTHLLNDLGWEVMEMTARQVYRSLHATAARLLRRLGA